MTRYSPIFWPLWVRRLFVLTIWPMLVLAALTFGLVADVFMCARGRMQWREIDDDIFAGIHTAVGGAYDLWQRQQREEKDRA